MFTIAGQPYSEIDDRVLQHRGAIVDLGCVRWDWSMCFVGRKRVIGADPLAEDLAGTELFRGLVGPATGEIEFIAAEDLSTIVNAANGNPDVSSVPMLNWKAFCTRYKIQDIAALKINIEGGEYGLLADLDSNDYAKIDQIAVSFHDWRWPERKSATSAALFRFGLEGFDVRQINQALNWHLAVKS